MNRQWTGRPPSSVHSSASGCCLVCIFRHPSKVKDPPTSLFSTISDPSVCMCEQDKACVELKEEVVGNHRVVGEMSSVCHLQFHHTTPSIAVNALRGHSSISIIYTYDHDLQACQKKALRWHITCGHARFGLRLHSIPALKVQYPPTLCIYQSHHGNLHSGGHKLAFWFSALRRRRFNTNQRSDLLWSFIKRCRLWGSRVVCSRSLPSGIRRELRGKG